MSYDDVISLSQVMHGGLFSEDGVTLDDLRKVERNRQPPDSGTVAFWDLELEEMVEWSAALSLSVCVLPPQAPCVTCCGRTPSPRLVPHPPG